MLPNNSYYGNYRTRTFSEIYPEKLQFIADYNQTFPNTMNENDLVNLYYLLMARYMNSHIINSDENQFKIKLTSIIFSYGPTWAKKLEIQSKLRNLSESDLITGSKAIHNHSYNPSTAPSTSSTEELLTIDDQNTTTYKKSKIEAYALLWQILNNDVTSEFITKFKTLFIQIAQPDYPLWDESEEED